MSWGDGTAYENAPAAEVVADLALSAAEPKEVSTTLPTAFVVPRGAELEVVDPARFDVLNYRPRRTKGTVRPGTLGALTEYVQRHYAASAASVWVAQETGEVVAILNDHEGADGEDAAGWGDHRAVFVPRKTPEWLRWTNADGKWLDQEAFAELLEDGLGEIALPDGGELLEVAQTMVGATSVEWQSAVRLDNGAVKASYIEEATAKAGQRGDLEVPTEFVLVLPVFYGEQPVQLNARLRWRLRSGKLLLGFRLDNPHRAVDQAIEAMAATLRERFGHVYIGTPRA